MIKQACTALGFAIITAIASAQSPQPVPQAMPGGQSAQILASLPGEALTVSHWYKQNVTTRVTTRSARSRTCLSIRTARSSQ
jgi:hypothetical protein